jgi:hypothetical protein
LVEFEARGVVSDALADYLDFLDVPDAQRSRLLRNWATLHKYATPKQLARMRDSNAVLADVIPGHAFVCIPEYHCVPYNIETSVWCLSPTDSKSEDADDPKLQYLGTLPSLSMIPRNIDANTLIDPSSRVKSAKYPTAGWRVRLTDDQAKHVKTVDGKSIPACNKDWPQLIARQPWTWVDRDADIVVLAVVPWPEGDTSLNIGGMRTMDDLTDKTPRLIGRRLRLLFEFMLLQNLAFKAGRDASEAYDERYAQLLRKYSQPWGSPDDAWTFNLLLMLMAREPNAQYRQWYIEAEAQLAAYRSTVSAVDPLIELLTLRPWRRPSWHGLLVPFEEFLHFVRDIPLRSMPLLKDGLVLVPHAQFSDVLHSVVYNVFRLKCQAYVADVHADAGVTPESRQRHNDWTKAHKSWEMSKVAHLHPGPEPALRKGKVQAMDRCLDFLLRPCHAKFDELWKASDGAHLPLRKSIVFTGGSTDRQARWEKFASLGVQVPEDLDGHLPPCLQAMYNMVTRHPERNTDRRIRFAEDHLKHEARQIYRLNLVAMLPPPSVLDHIRPSLEGAEGKALKDDLERILKKNTMATGCEKIASASRQECFCPFTAQPVDIEDLGQEKPSKRTKTQAATKSAPDTESMWRQCTASRPDFRWPIKSPLQFVRQSLTLQRRKQEPETKEQHESKSETIQPPFTPPSPLTPPSPPVVDSSASAPMLIDSDFASPEEAMAFEAALLAIDEGVFSG